MIWSELPRVSRSLPSNNRYLLKVKYLFNQVFRGSSKLNTRKIKIVIHLEEDPFNQNKEKDMYHIRACLKGEKCDLTSINIIWTNHGIYMTLLTFQTKTTNVYNLIPSDGWLSFLQNHAVKGKQCWEDCPQDGVYFISGRWLSLLSNQILNLTTLNKWFSTSVFPFSQELSIL